MADDLEPPPVKRMRYNLRSSARLKSNVTTGETNDKHGANGTVASNRPAIVPRHSTYRLRSCGKINSSETVELPRKRKKPSLLTLNPDCLLKLFDYLDLVDLCSMAETCTSLFNYAKYHFRLKHKNFDFASMYNGDLLDVGNATQLLRIFGDQIRTLKVSRDFFKDNAVHYPNTDTVSNQLLRSVADYCQQIVKVLALDGINFAPGMLVDHLSALCNSLEMLSLDQCTMYDVAWCNMQNLKVLKLTEVEGFEAYFWRVKFNKLEVVELERLDIDVENLTNFIHSVPNIKRLSIVKCGYITTAIFGAIKLLKNLEELEFQLNRPNRSEEVHQRDLMHLTELKKLKVLKLHCNKKSVRQLIDGICEKKISLEQLELAHGLVDIATVEAITKLKTVKVLKLNNMIEFADYLMSPIAKKMNQLEEFHIKTEANITQFRIKEIVRSANRLTCLKIDANDFSLKTDTYNAILSVVKNRKDDIRLAVTLYSDGNQPTIPADVLNGPNEKWLKVNTFDRNSNRLFQLYTWTSDETDSEDEFDDEEELMIFEALRFRQLMAEEDTFDGFDSDEDVEIEMEDED